MKTRFDLYGKWITARGELVNVSEMETDHLLNTLRMLIQKPSRTMSMLIHDIENCTDVERIFSPWNADAEVDDMIKQSLHNATSMTPDQLQVYVMKTPVFQSMCDELSSRGVNMINIMGILSTCEAF